MGQHQQVAGRVGFDLGHRAVVPTILVVDLGTDELVDPEGVVLAFEGLGS